MKWILLFAFFLSWVQVHSQTFMVKERIAVATTKTVSLIFPAHVQSIDRGSDHFIVQKAAANIVKVKAVKDSEAGRAARTNSTKAVTSSIG